MPTDNLTVRTSQHRQFVDVTRQLQTVVRSSGILDGIAVVYSPHTTAAVTINENADPNVLGDLLDVFTDLVGDERRFQHAEGNSGGHALTSLVGPSVSIPIRAGALLLGQWQSVYLCEFDGPRQRTLHIQLIGEVTPGAAHAGGDSRGVSA